jgi:hypothetical protein
VRETRHQLDLTLMLAGTRSNWLRWIRVARSARQFVQGSNRTMRIDQETRETGKAAVAFSSRVTQRSAGSAVHPITLGGGKRSFAGGTIPAAFKVTESTVASKGVIIEITSVQAQSQPGVSKHSRRVGHASPVASEALPRVAAAL